MPIGYVRRAAQQRLRMTRRRSACDASICPSILWPVRSRGRHVLARRLDRAPQHLDHPPDLRLRGNERRRHRDGLAGEAEQHPLFHSALEYLKRTHARLALQRFDLDRRRQSDVADVRDARLALQRVHGLLEYGLQGARLRERALFPIASSVACATAAAMGWPE